MLRGIYASNTGLNAIQYKIDTVSHNLANVNTPGFKEQKTSFTTFKEALLTINGEETIGDISHGAQPGKTKTDFTLGNFKETGRKLDFAVKGDAFFVLQTPDGFKYTRSGSFQKDRDGYLVDKKGNRVLGVAGAIRITKGKPDQKFRLVAFQNKDYLVKTGENLYNAAPQAGVYPAEKTDVLQGYLETSNVDVIENVSDLIISARNYSLNSRALTVQDRILGKTVNEVGTIK
ncbi:MAG: flagellar basal-body rod protein FlgF [Clostridiales bacterium]|jgi:flagellar basal-body rod protein FlgG|nr:flagellar basal-body rod protein FlgF [Clostridiales bacterium]